MFDEYEASIVCAVYDNSYNFDDVLHIGISHSPMESYGLLMQDIFRVMQDFGEKKCSIETAYSNYEHVMVIVHTEGKDGFKNHWHYYLLFASERSKDEESIQEE